MFYGHGNCPFLKRFKSKPQPHSIRARRSSSLRKLEWAKSQQENKRADEDSSFSQGGGSPYILVLLTKRYILMAYLTAQAPIDAGTGEVAPSTDRLTS